jgi:hypothetical protein
MKINLSKRDRKLLLWAGIAVAVYVLLNYWILPHYDSLVEARDKIEVQERRVTNFRKILGGKSSAQGALAASQVRMANLEAGLLTSGSDALASAEIQGLVKNVVISKNMSFRRSDVLPVVALSREYSRVPTRVEIGGTIEQFHDLLKAFLLNPKHLVVEELRIVPLGGATATGKMIQINLTVSGLRRAEPVPAGNGKKS